MQPSRAVPPAPPADRLRSDSVRGLQLPLAALRASLEALADGRDEPDARRRTLDGALAELARVDRAVRDLAEYGAAPRPMPLRCTVGEIVGGALGALDDAARPRVLVAHDAELPPLVVDGPLLARTLRRLVENALEAGPGLVLLGARRDRGDLVLCVVNPAAARVDWEAAAAPFATTKPGRLGLGLTIAARDVALLGGRLDLEHGARGAAVARVRLPEAAR